MIDYRLRYRKTGLIRFTSHLDTMRIFSRAFNRSGLPIWFTEGFNPHPYIVLGLPLSLGFETLCDLCDFRLTEEVQPQELAERLQECLPEGLEIISVYRGGSPISAIAFAEYVTQVSGEEPFNQNDLESVKEIYEKQDLTAVKKTKNGEKTIALRDYIKTAEISLKDGSLELHSILSAGNDSLNPEMFVSALCRDLKEAVITKHTRNAIFDSKMERFV